MTTINLDYFVAVAVVAATAARELKKYIETSTSFDHR